MELVANNIYNCDCMDLMREIRVRGVQFGDTKKDTVDWVITDMPYGINYTSMNMGVGGGGFFTVTQSKYKKTNWDSKRISKDYFDMMFDISDNQLFFGGNYYTDYLPITRNWAIWDKRLSNKNRNDYADCEMIWASKGGARVFRYYYNGALQGDMKNKEERFHPTQKPTQIITQLLDYYTKEGDLILDCFSGSGSIAVACRKMNRNFIACEIDKYYYDKSIERMNNIFAQMSFLYQ